MRAGRTVATMTDFNGRPTRRRFTWGVRNQGNRIVYSLITGWLVWLAVQRPSGWLALAVAALVYTAITAALRISR